MTRIVISAESNLITTYVKVDRSRIPWTVLKATGRVQDTNRGVVDSMPRNSNDPAEVEVVFINLGRAVTYLEIECELKLHGLMFADPYALAAVNEADPSFADTHPNCTHWRGKNGYWYCIAFDKLIDRVVYVGRTDDCGWWSGDWWFAGVRK